MKAGAEQGTLNLKDLFAQKRQTEERWEDNIKEWTGLEWNGIAES